ncbi:MAG: hypothetical protein QXL94_05130 [Candidatus Parvarchaeum sp.]
MYFLSVYKFKALGVFKISAKRKNYSSKFKEAKDGIRAYIYFYNYKKPYEGLGYETPMSIYVAGLEG